MTVAAHPEYYIGKGELLNYLRTGNDKLKKERDGFLTTTV